MRPIVSLGASVVHWGDILSSIVGIANLAQIPRLE